MKTINIENFLNVGYVKKIVGFNGRLALSLKIKIKKPSYILIEVEGSFVPFKVSDIEIIENVFFINIPHLKKIDDVEFLKGKSFFVENQYLDEAEKSIYEIIGYKIYSIKNEYLGKVSNIMNNSLSRVLVVISENNDEILIPYTEKFIVENDKKEKKLILDLPEGL